MMPPPDTATKNNLFAGQPDSTANEIFQTLLTQPDLKIERIVSTGQSSPPGFWYDQPEGEWVVLLAGAARLQLAEPDEMLALGPGDYVNILPHRRHRVDWTHPVETTIWLAVFYRPPALQGT